MVTRKEGQIWIDKNNTHRLKYHIGGITYEIATSQTFSANRQPSVKKGQLVASSGGELVAAVWPDDAEKVLGVVTGTEGENSKYVTSVASSERIILENAEEIKGCFVDGAALPSDEWATDSKKGIGCPVYWFIGLSKSASEYTDSSTKKGMLTFKTPSGFKYGVTTVSDEQFNISYDNLPIVGHVADYECSKERPFTFTRLVIDLQVSTYTPTVTWNYPGIHGSASGHKCGTLESGKEHKFYHGLFANNAKNNICICNLVIRAISADKTYPEGTDAEEHTVVAPYRNVIKATNDRFTGVTFNTMESLRYRITGTVHYNIDRSQA